MGVDGHGVTTLSKGQGDGAPNPARTAGPESEPWAEVTLISFSGSDGLQRPSCLILQGLVHKWQKVGSPFTI